MEKQEFLLLIPGIIYGVAIVDLLKIVQHKRNYWILVLISIINHWIELYQKLGTLVDSNFNFFLIIGQAMIYAQAANIITPGEQDSDTKAYFFKIRKKFFLILVGVILANMLLQFVVFDDHRTWIRVIGLPLFLACAYIDKLWVRSSIGVYYFGLAMAIIFILN